MLKAIASGDTKAARKEWSAYLEAGFRGEDAIRAAIHFNKLTLIPTFLECGAKATELLSTELLPFIGRSTFKTLVGLVNAGAPVNNSDGTSEALEAEVLSFLHRSYDLGELPMGFGDSPKVPNFDCRTMEYLLARGARLSSSDNVLSESFIQQCKTEKQSIAPALRKLLTLFNHYGAEMPLRLLENLVLSHIIFSNLRDTPSTILEQAIIDGDLAKVQRVMHEEPTAISNVSRPLHLAIGSRSTAMIKHFLSQNYKIDEYVWHELLSCEHRGEDFQQEIVKLLLEGNPDLGIKRGAPFIAACQLRDPEILNLLVHQSDSLNGAFPRDLALSALLELEKGFNAPATQILPTAKALIQRGADPNAALTLAKALDTETYAARLYKDPENRPNLTGEHYSDWISFLKQSLANPERTRRFLPFVSEDQILRAHIDVLFQMANLVQCGPMAPSHVAFAHKKSTLYALLMAQVLDPENPCFFNKLVPFNHQLSMNRIHPQELRHNRNYQTIANLAAFATIMYNASSLRKNFITLVETTFANTPNESDRQAKTESIFELIPPARALVEQFAKYVLRPALIKKTTPYTYGLIHHHLRNLFMRQDLAQLAAEVLFNGRSLNEIKELTKRWQKVSTRHPIPIRMSTYWPPILEKPLFIDAQSRVEEITSCRRLREIGQQMGNCLKTGIHAPECFYGIARILVIYENHAGIDRPTIALTLRRKDTTWTITEYEGAHYIPVDESPTAPLTKFKEMLASDQVPLKDAPALTVKDIEQHTPNLDRLKELHRYENFLEDDSNAPLIEPGMDAEAFYSIVVETLTHSVKSGDEPTKLLTEERITQYHTLLHRIKRAIETYQEFQAMIEAREVTSKHT